MRNTQLRGLRFFVGRDWGIQKSADDLSVLIKEKALMTAQSSGLNFSPHAAGLMLFWGFIRRADDFYTPRAGKRTAQKEKPSDLWLLKSDGSRTNIPFARTLGDDAL